MKLILTQIQDGTFARQWIAEYAAGNPNYKALKQADLDHPIEATGRKLRAAMSWLHNDNVAATPAARPRSEAAAA
jgi:ketol-acid reductoisomerase